MSAASELAVSKNTSALFARLPRNSERVILPINDSALGTDLHKPAFYCVHSASGVAGTDFVDLAERFEPAVRFYGIQAPPKHLEDRDFGKSVESLAEHYVDALEQFQPKGAVLLGGYCLGAVIALAMANALRSRGRVVGPVVAIDGVPENTGVATHRWKPRYWFELLRNVPRWLNHGVMMRNWTLHSLAWSLSHNAAAIGKIAIGLRPGEKIGGGYTIESVMDVSRYDPAHKSFINRLFSAAFAFVPKEYPEEVVVYEASITPLLYLPQIGRTWREFAPKAQVVPIEGTHISIMHPPHVDALAADLRKRIVEFHARQPATV